MPCDQVQTSKIDIAAGDKSLLLEALQTEFKARVDYGVIRFGLDGCLCSIDPDGKLTVMDTQRLSLDQLAQLRNKVQRAYARAVLRETAKKRGWKVEEKSPTEFVYVKRS